MPDTQTWIDALRQAHERFVGLVRPLSAEAVEQPAYPTEWSIADVASHLGSQSEILQMFLEAGLTGRAAPGREEFQPVWDRWNALPPTEQVSRSISANQAFVDRLTQTTPKERERFSVPMFGADADVARLASARLSEYAVHTWDIAVALDPAATVAPDAVELLVDQLPVAASRSGRADETLAPVVVRTTDPERIFRLALDPEVVLEPSDEAGPDALVLPAEVFLRLVYGRLDAEHTPPTITDPRLAGLRGVFRGY